MARCSRLPQRRSRRLSRCFSPAGAPGPGRARRPPSLGQLTAAAPAERSTEPSRPGTAACGKRGEKNTRSFPGEAVGKQSVLCCARRAPSAGCDVNGHQQSLRGDREPGGAPEPRRSLHSGRVWSESTGAAGAERANGVCRSHS